MNDFGSDGFLDAENKPKAKVKLRSLIHSFFDFLFPPKCVCCGRILEVKAAFCEECRARYENNLLRQCSQCGKAMKECDCSGHFLSNNGIRKLYKIFKYRPKEPNEPENKLIYALKSKHLHYVFDLLSSELSEVLFDSIDKPERYVITYIPRSKAGKSKNGYDHMKCLAQYLGRKMALRVENVLFLTNTNAPEQKGLSRAERIKNAKGLFMVKDNFNTDAKNYLLLDDISTSGATLINAQKALYRSGANKVLCCVCGVSTKDL